MDEIWPENNQIRAVTFALFWCNGSPSDHLLEEAIFLHRTKSVNGVDDPSGDSVLANSTALGN